MNGNLGILSALLGGVMAGKQAKIQREAKAADLEYKKKTNEQLNEYRQKQLEYLKAKGERDANNIQGLGVYSGNYGSMLTSVQKDTNKLLDDVRKAKLPSERKRIWEAGIQTLRPRVDALKNLAGTPMVGKVFGGLNADDIVRMGVHPAALSPDYNEDAIGGQFTYDIKPEMTAVKSIRDKYAKAPSAMANNPAQYIAEMSPYYRSLLNKGYTQEEALLALGNPAPMFADNKTLMARLFQEDQAFAPDTPIQTSTGKQEILPSGGVAPRAGAFGVNASPLDVPNLTDISTQLGANQTVNIGTPQTRNLFSAPPAGGMFAPERPGIGSLTQAPTTVGNARTELMAPIEAAGKIQAQNIAAAQAPVKQQILQSTAKIKDWQVATQPWLLSAKMVDYFTKKVNLDNLPAMLKQKLDLMSEQVSASQSRTGLNRQRFVFDVRMGFSKWKLQALEEYNKNIGLKEKSYLDAYNKAAIAGQLTAGTDEERTLLNDLLSGKEGSLGRMMNAVKENKYAPGKLQSAFELGQQAAELKNLRDQKDKINKLEPDVDQMFDNLFDESTGFKTTKPAPAPAPAPAGGGKDNKTQKPGAPKPPAAGTPKPPTAGTPKPPAGGTPKPPAGAKPKENKPPARPSF